MDPGLCAYAESLNVLADSVQTDFYENRIATIAMYVGAQSDSENHLISDMTVNKKRRPTHNPPRAVSLSFFLRIFLCVIGVVVFFYLYFIFNEKKGDNHICL